MRGTPAQSVHKSLSVQETWLHLTSQGDMPGIWRCCSVSRVPIARASLRTFRPEQTDQKSFVRGLLPGPGPSRQLEASKVQAFPRPITNLKMSARNHFARCLTATGRAANARQALACVVTCTPRHVCWSYCLRQKKVGGIGTAPYVRGHYTTERKLVLPRPLPGESPLSHHKKKSRS